MTARPAGASSRIFASGWGAFRARLGFFLSVAFLQWIVSAGTTAFLLGPSLLAVGAPPIFDATALDSQSTLDSFEAWMGRVRDELFTRSFLVALGIAAAVWMVVQLVSLALHARMALATVDQERSRVREIAAQALRPRALLALALAAILQMGGTLLCVLPGLVASLYFVFVPVAAADRSRSALDDSIQLVRARFTDALVAWLIFVGAGPAVSSLAGVVPFWGPIVFGTLLAGAAQGLSVCIVAATYRAIRPAAGSAPSAVASGGSSPPPLPPPLPPPIPA